MKTVLKWTLSILAGTIGAALVLVIALIGLSLSRQRKSYAIPPRSLVLHATADLARGEHLVTVGCTGCHGPGLGGVVMMHDFKMGTLSSRNLTSGDGGIGRTFTTADFVRAIRYGVGPNHTTLLFMPTGALEHLGDSDLASIIAYVQQVPPVNNETPAPSIGPLARILSVLTPFPLYSAEHATRGATQVMPPATDTLAYGGYLANIAGCKECHGPTLANGKVGPNLTRGGPLATWSEADFTRAIREGKRPDGTSLTDAMPWKEFGKLTDAELHALWTYVRTVPPVTPPPKKK